MAGIKQILADHEQDGIGYGVPVLVGGQVVQLACASICFRTFTYPMIRTGSQQRRQGLRLSPRYCRPTGTWRPSGDSRSQKIWICIALFYWMGGYKHIEKCIGAYVAAHVSPSSRDRHWTEHGCRPVHSRCGHQYTGNRYPYLPAARLADLFLRRYLFAPDLSCYAGADVIYAVRPAEEMIPPLVALAEISTAICGLPSRL